MTFAAFATVVMLAAATPVPVTVERDDGRWRLVRGGEPYFVKGAGGDTDAASLDRLVTYGGNSVRTWGVGPDAAALLDRARARGLTVTLGVWVDHDLDLADDAACDATLEHLRAAVLAHRRHPALLAWSIGNESEAGRNTAEYWQFIQRLAAEVGRLDPHHPILTVTADLGPAGTYGPMIREHAPAVDVWGVNTYGGLASLGARLDAAGWDGPVLVTEFGPPGQWEVPTTSWGTPLEPTSTLKSARLSRNYAQVLLKHPKIVGGYAFLWGQKQEATATWFGLFLQDGTPTEMTDVLRRHWAGAWPGDLAPRVLGLACDAGPRPVAPGTSIVATLDAYDPEGGELTYEWQLRRASPGGSHFGRAEPETADYSHLLQKPFGPRVEFPAPPDPGPYRLFVVARDARAAATANVPFLVE